MIQGQEELIGNIEISYSPCLDFYVKSDQNLILQNLIDCCQFQDRVHYNIAMISPMVRKVGKRKGSCIDNDEDEDRRAGKRR